VSRHVGRAPRTNRGGFTLVELVVSMLLLSLIVGAFCGAVFTAQSTYTAQRAILRAQQGLRSAELTIATVLRAGGADPHRTDSTLIDPDPLGHGTFDNLRVVGDFNPPDGDVEDPLEDVLVRTGGDTLYVRWQADGPEHPVATPVRELAFEYYAEDGSVLTQPSDIPGARSVRLRLSAPRGPRSDVTEARETWIYLRNGG